MKKYIVNFILSCCFMSLINGCTDFEELNRNPSKSDMVDPNSQLAYVQIQRFGDLYMMESEHAYASAFTQQMMGNWRVTNYGGQYRKDNSQFDNLWSRIYGVCIKNLEDILRTTNDLPEYTNVRQLARIYKVYYSMILTDLFGDIPYFEAGKGYSDGIIKPSYDKQELIYKDFIKELTEAEALLSTSGDKVTGDIIYGGDIDKNKRLANSLRLRVAMRIVNVEEDLAREQVVEILNSETGLFSSSDDDALIRYMNLNDWDYSEYRRNALSQFRRGRESESTPYICAVFWDFLKYTNDPRLYRIGRTYYENSPNNPFGRTDITDDMLQTDPELFQPIKPGFFRWDNWPSGYWSDFVNAYLETECIPQLNNAFLRGDNPGMLLTYAETQLLLAEAKVRWGASINTDAEECYINGVTAAMKYLNDNYQISRIADDEISDYFIENSFPTDTEEQIKAINEQLWVLLLNDHFEAYANWRRTDYPELQPSSHYGALTIESQVIPTRLCYPIFESTYNKEGYDAALAGMGGTDNWNASVWWDKNN